MGGVHTIIISREEDSKIILVQLGKEKGKPGPWECFAGLLSDVFWEHVAPDGLGVSNGAHQSGATGVDSATLDTLDQPSRRCRTKTGDDHS